MIPGTSCLATVVLSLRDKAITHCNCRFFIHFRAIEPRSSQEAMRRVSRLPAVKPATESSNSWTAPDTPRSDALL
jgi:hypothetical protein